MIDPAIKTPQFPHQAEIYLAQRDSQFYALFHEMGLGKSKIILDVASHLHGTGKIDALLIIAPHAVASNWLSQEIPPHLAAPHIGMHYRTKGAGSERGRLKQLYMLNADVEEWRGKLRIVTMSYDSLITDRGQEFAKRITVIYRTMIVADESTAIKTTTSARAKIIKEIASFSHYRWICTGTPVAQSPFDVHSQLEFLCPTFWVNHGMRTRESFKQQFGMFELKHVGGGKKVQSVVGYKRLDYLSKIIAPISSRLLKEDSTIKLPPKIYTTRTFALSETQIKAYDELRDEFMVELDSGVVVDAPLAFTRLIRLQQICSGFVSASVGEAEIIPPGLPGPRSTDSVKLTTNDREERGLEAAYGSYTHASVPASTQLVMPDVIRNPVITPRAVSREIVELIPPGENPRLRLLLELLEEAHHKVIVWCRFTYDVDLITTSLGDTCVRYDGQVNTRDREIALTRFRDPSDKARIFVANVHAISQGVTLVIAKTVVYFTNSHSPEKRLQSEDRNHRIGQDVSVHIIDLVAEGTVDVKLIEALIRKFDVAAQVTGDKFREWISLSPREVVE